MNEMTNTFPLRSWKLPWCPRRWTTKQIDIIHFAAWDLLQNNFICIYPVSGTERGRGERSSQMMHGWHTVSDKSNHSRCHLWNQCVRVCVCNDAFTANAGCHSGYKCACLCSNFVSLSVCVCVFMHNCVYIPKPACPFGHDCMWV